MKIIFNDATELQVQSVQVINNLLQIKTVSATRGELRERFSDKFACKTIKVEERGQILATYENYTELYRIEEYEGTILGVAMYKQGETPEERLTAVEVDMKTAQEDIEKLKESGAGVDPALFSASVVVARANAQTLEDEQALQAKVLYPTWAEGIGQTVKKGFKFVYEEALYKTIQDSLLIQEQYVPGQGTESLYTVIDETHAGTREDPIPYSGNMELESGKYYSQGGVTYLCNRDTGQAVFQPLADLVGIYVEIVE